jgi:hypothetical protein
MVPDVASAETGGPAATADAVHNPSCGTKAAAGVGEDTAASSVSDESCCPVCLDCPGATAVVLQPCNHQVCYSCCNSLWQMQGEQGLLLCPLCSGPVGDFARSR